MLEYNSSVAHLLEPNSVHTQLPLLISHALNQLVETLLLVPLGHLGELIVG